MLKPPPGVAFDADIPTLIARLVAAQAQLEAAAGPGIDTVLDVRGETHLLREAQQALRKSEKRFRALIEHSVDGIALVSAAGSLLYHTPSVQQLIGYEAEQWTERTLLEFVHPEDRDAAQALLATAAVTPHHPVTLRWRLSHRSGTTRWVEGTATNRLQDPDLGAIVLNFHDVTDREEAHARLARLNRVHAMWSQINQAIVREANVDSVLARSCCIAVDAGRFVFAWIGVREPDRPFRAAALAGNAPAYRSWLQHALETGPLAVAAYGAYKRGEPFLWADVAAEPGPVEPDLAEPRAALLAAGIHSLASFPIFVDGRRYGAFTLYAGTPNFFDAAEVALLGSLAEDLGFAFAFHAHAEDRTRAWAALEASERRYRHLLDSIQAGVVVHDATGHIKSFNQTACSLLGRSAEEMRGDKGRQTEWTFVRPDGAALPQEELPVYRALATQRPVRSSVLGRRRGDEIQWFQASADPILGRTGVVEVIVTFMDVTARVRAEQESARQAAFAAFNPNPVLELSSGGAVLYANTAAAQWASSFTGGRILALLPPAVSDIIAGCLQTGRAHLRVEHPLASRVFSWSFFPIPSSNSVHCYGGDITERKQLQDQFLQAQKMEALGQLSGGVAHDFNNLLQVIKANLSLMQGTHLLSVPDRTALDQVGRAADRAANLTRQLLMFSRRRIVQKQSMDLAGTVRDMATLLRRTVGEHIDLQLGEPMPALHLEADPGMIDQVILNLVVNARDAMPRGGRVRLEIGRRTLEASAGVPNRRPGEFACLSVQDTGSGIAPEHLPNIFEPFFTTKTAGQGTGLGLATVRSIVQQHDGWIEVHSLLNVGTTFEVFLPLTAGEPAPTVPVAVAVPPGGTETVFLVEDEEAVRATLELFLSRNGYRVVTASDASEARAQWSRHRDAVQLLLTDLLLPGGTSGLELATEFQAHKPELGVVYMSGYTPEHVAKHVRFDQGQQFLSKPFRLDQLLAIVRRNLDRSRPGRMPS
jgi:PAS domain S-box-containing protein